MVAALTATVTFATSFDCDRAGKSCGAQVVIVAFRQEFQTQPAQFAWQLSGVSPNSKDISIQIA
jgi:hypothetical protein